MRALVLCLVAGLVFRIDAFTCDLPPHICEIIERKENVVDDLARNVADLFENRERYLRRCQCSLHSCTNDVSDFVCSTDFGSYSEVCGEGCEGRRINYNTSMFRVPPNTNTSDMSAKLKESICVFANLDATMKNLSISDEHSYWLFFGGVDGSYRVYPAQARKRGCVNGDPFLRDCWPFEPRIRPWFIAASTRWKDIVLVIDISRPMDDPVKDGGSETRLDVTKRAVSAMLNTFSTFDYVSIVVFSNKATRLSVDSPLQQATEENVNFLRKQMEDQKARGKANFDAAFSEAFDVLTEACSKGNKNCSGCQKVILFLTDGRDHSAGRGESIKASEMLSNIEKYQTKLEKKTSTRAKIFTFSMGETSDDSIPRQIACRNSGAWSFISEDTDPLAAMAGYYHFLTNSNNLATPIWMDPYEDHGGLGMITTVTRPVYSKGTRDLDGVFLGAVGYDVLKEELEVPGHPWEITVANLRERSQFCNMSSQSPCQLQVHRNAYANKSICADNISPTNRSASNDDDPTGDDACYEFSKKYYKFFSRQVSWNEASQRCGKDKGRLVVIESEEELAFVAGVSSPDGSWISARRRDGKRHRFEWTESDISNRLLESSSTSWGVGEPNNYDGVEDCVHIDRRGANGNLNDEDCSKELSFICEYTRKRSCKKVVKTPKQGYFEIPPLSACLDENASVANAQPSQAAAALSKEDVMCPLGEPKGSFEVICCSDCSDPSDSKKRQSSDSRQC